LQSHSNQQLARAKKVGRAGGLKALRLSCWRAIKEAEAIFGDPLRDDEIRLRAISAHATQSGVYYKILVESEIEKRLEKLEGK